MMRTWVRTNVGKIVLGAATVSVVTHLAIITWWVVATLPSADVAKNGIANHIFYIPPPDRVPTQPGSGESIHYVTLDQPGYGSGDGPRMMGDARPTTPAAPGGKKNDSVDSVSAEPVAPTTGKDSVYSVLEVETAVVRSTRSAAPAYPLKLLESHVQGFVNARYVVDTTGFADTASFRVLDATNKGFIDAVKDALPYMRFSPAKIGSVKVRQLVQQQFSFKITDTVKAVPKKKA
jgi:hypothetical protein